MLAPVISAEIQQGSGSMNSWRASFPIPSAQRTGVPMAGRFSTIQAESLFPLPSLLRAHLPGLPR